MTITIVQLEKILNDATIAAETATREFVQNKLGGKDMAPCGGAYANIIEYDGKRINGRSKIGKMIQVVGNKYGIRKSETFKNYRVYNPSAGKFQNSGAQYAGAVAYCAVLNMNGFSAYADEYNN